ncbi:MAG TPA: glycoside hydrolase family 5 protein [Verrucomicrobiae bacterium]|jgi:endoglucanase|nr:glycoside hydrolase family 5 protein [Verrucomicrobiae bacterium]
MSLRHVMFLASALAASAQTNPVQVAVQARFDLEGDGNTQALNLGYLTAGAGSVDRQTWLAPSDQTNSYTVNFNIAHFAWTPASFRFTPASSGTVNLTIRGPWEMSPNGAIYKQEVLWDGCSAVNATLTNGSFENVLAGLPSSWWRTYGTDAAVDTGPVAPEDGVRYVRVWHDGPLSCNFAVQGGVPVTLNFFARAFFPANFTDMPRLASTNTPAHLAARKFMRGVNMGNYLEVPPGETWQSTYTTNDFINIRREGFDHVRIPGGWNYYVGSAPNYTIAPAFFAKTDFMVTNALQQGLSVIINIHNWNEFATNAAANTNEFYAIWRQIAAYYSNRPPSLAFELINEPNGPGSATALLNPIYAEAIREIRLTNPSRTIFVGPSQWNAISELGSLQLPPGDSNLIVTVHCYDPFYFTHQGATWPGPDTATTGVIFPGPPPHPLQPAAGIGDYVTNWFVNYNTLPADGNPSSPLAFAGEQQEARQWSDYYGRPVHIGEFGAYTMGDAASRARFYTAFRAGADALGLGWAMWDWNAGFMYWDPNTKQPAPGMRAAMFPAPSLTTTGPGAVTFSAALAKTFRLDRNWAFGSPAGWTPIATNSLTATNWNYFDPAALNSNAAFYRAYWMK